MKKMPLCPPHHQCQCSILSQESQCSDTDGRNEKLATHGEAGGSTVEGNGGGLGGAGASCRSDTGTGTGSGGRCSGVAQWVGIRHGDGHDSGGYGGGRSGGGGSSCCGAWSARAGQRSQCAARGGRRRRDGGGCAGWAVGAGIGRSSAGNDLQVDGGALGAQACIVEVVEGAAQAVVEDGASGDSQGAVVADGEASGVERVVLEM